MYKLVEHCLLLLAAGYKQASPIKMLLILGPFSQVSAQAFTSHGAWWPLRSVFELPCLLSDKRSIGYNTAGIYELTAISVMWASRLILASSWIKGWHHD